MVALQTYRTDWLSAPGVSPRYLLAVCRDAPRKRTRPDDPALLQSAAVVAMLCRLGRWLCAPFGEVIGGWGRGRGAPGSCENLLTSRCTNGKTDDPSPEPITFHQPSSIHLTCTLFPSLPSPSLPSIFLSSPFAPTVNKNQMNALFQFAQAGAGTGDRPTAALLLCVP